MADITVDASVVAAMVFGEERAPEARSLLRGAELYSPTLLAYELASVARVKSLRSPEIRQSIREMLIAALGMEFHWVEVAHAEALELALATGLSTYDASYLYVAMTGGMKLVTFDQRLQAAANEM